MASAPTAPTADTFVSYPMLYNDVAHALDPTATPGAAATVSETPSVNAKNQVCPFCDEAISTALKPVALLPCGHAYHVMCGRSLLFSREGAECTHSVCHRSENDVETDMMRRIIEAAILREEFQRSDLKDPVLRRDIMEKVQQRMDEAHRTGVQPSNADVIKGDERSVDAYHGRWKKRSGIARDGFSYMQKGKLLSPFTKNPLQIKKLDVTMQLLLAKEDELRRKGQEDEDEDDNTITHTAVENADDMHERISVQRFIDAGLTLADIYFKLDIQAWQSLCDYGFKREYITSHTGAFPITGLADLYGVEFKSFVKDIDWSINDIVRVGNTAQELADVGLDFKKLYVDMGMVKTDVFRLGFTPRAWHDTLLMDKQYLVNKPLAITSIDLELLRWSKAEVIQAFALHPIEQLQMGISDAGAVEYEDAPVINDDYAIERTLARARAIEELDGAVVTPALERPLERTKRRKPVTILTLKGRA